MRYMANFKVLGGQKIIVNFEKRPVDVEETKKVIAPLIEETDLFQDRVALLSRRVYLIAHLNEIETRKGNHQKELNSVNEDLTEVNEQLQAVSTDLKDLSEKLFSENAVYSEVRNTVIPTVEMYKTWNELQIGEFLTTEGEVLTIADIERIRISKMSREQKQAELKVVKRLLAEKHLKRVEIAKLLGENIEQLEIDFSNGIQKLESSYV